MGLMHAYVNLGVNAVLLFLLGSSQITFMNELNTRIQAGNQFAKDLIVLNIAVDPAELCEY